MSNIYWEKYRNYTVEKIMTSSVEWEPYWHVVIENTLHEDLYEQVRLNWPNMADYQTKTNPKGFNQNRRIFIPESGQIDFWQEYYLNIMTHPDIQEAVYNLEELPDRGTDWVTSSLWEDYRGYGVKNHYDGYTIHTAWQTYIYCNGGERWGTSLNDEKGTEMVRLPFRNNLSWIMKVDAYSWHSCEEILCTLRQSIMTRFMAAKQSN